MAFKQTRPLKMKGPLKRAGLNLGRAKNKPVDSSGIYYNGKMGPMKMVSPSALKAMEDEGMMEDMMGMMGEGAPVEEGAMPEAPVEEGAPVEKGEDKEGEDKVENWIFGQETGEVYKDEHGLYVVMGEGDDMYRGTDPNYDQKLYIPQEFVEEWGALEGDMIDDRDIGYEKVDGRWTITEIDIHEEEKTDRGEGGE